MQWLALPLIAVIGNDSNEYWIVWLGHDSTTLCDSTRDPCDSWLDSTRALISVTRLGLDLHDSWLDSGLVPSDSSTALPVLYARHSTTIHITFFRTCGHVCTSGNMYMRLCQVKIPEWNGVKIVCGTENGSHLVIVIIIKCCKVISANKFLYRSTIYLVSELWVKGIEDPGLLNPIQIQLCGLRDEITASSATIELLRAKVGRMWQSYTIL